MNSSGGKPRTDITWFNEVQTEYKQVRVVASELLEAIKENSIDYQIAVVKVILAHFPHIKRTVRTMDIPSSREAKNARRDFDMALSTYLHAAKYGRKLLESTDNEHIELDSTRLSKREVERYKWLFHQLTRKGNQQLKKATSFFENQR